MVTRKQLQPLGWGDKENEVRIIKSYKLRGERAPENGDLESPRRGVSGRLVLVSPILRGETLYS